MSRFAEYRTRKLTPVGISKDFDAVIDFYEDRFTLKLSKQERSDLIAFLRSL